MKGYGLADLRTGAPITRWTRFEIASVSKTFTATALLMLQQRGLVSIDDDIRKFIPELPQYAGGPVRLRDMLRHVSGLPSYFDLKNVPMSRKDLLGQRGLSGGVGAAVAAVSAAIFARPQIRV